ncbi:MAG: membrane protein insertase YidC [Pseudomonadota bacterium]
MDNQRIFLWAGLAVLLFLNVQTWQHDYSPPTPAVAVAQTTAAGAAAAPATTGGSLYDAVPGAGAPPAAPPAVSPAPTTSAVPAAVVGAPTETPIASTIHVSTDVLQLEISTLGGEIRDAQLRKYPRRKDTPNDLIHLMSADGADGPSVFQWGLTTGGTAAEPNQKALFTAAASHYELADNQDELSIPLTWTDDAGLTVTRTIHLRRGSYTIELMQSVKNQSAAPWRARAYSQITHHWAKAERSMWDPSTYSFKGPAVYNAKKYQKLDLEKPDPDQLPKAPLTGGWAAALEHHFVVAIVPDPAAATDYTLSVKDKDYRLGVIGPWQDVAPGAAAAFHETLFIGPKLQEQLSAVAPKLDLTADYGRLTVIAQPLFWLLSHVHRLIGNWGFAIIIVTFLIKLAFYPLAQTSGRSMARMRNIAPRMKAMQERYKDDREQLGKQMMELYKREKVNPLAGCLPILVQIPVFMGFYWVLLESVEVRQAPFMLWIQDLSLRDPYFVLPAIMGAAMFGQFKLNPAPPDPVQAKMFAFMPLVMTAMMAFFPAGLVLYWITNTVLSMAQQWRINQLVELEAKPR